MQRTVARRSVSGGSFRGPERGPAGGRDAGGVCSGGGDHGRRRSGPERSVHVGVAGLSAGAPGAERGVPAGSGAGAGVDRRPAAAARVRVAAAGALPERPLRAGAGRGRRGRTGRRRGCSRRRCSGSRSSAAGTRRTSRRTSVSFPMASTAPWQRIVWRSCGRPQATPSLPPPASRAGGGIPRLRGLSRDGGGGGGPFSHGAASPVYAASIPASPSTKCRCRRSRCPSTR